MYFFRILLECRAKRLGGVISATSFKGISITVAVFFEFDVVEIYKNIHKKKKSIENNILLFLCKCNGLILSAKLTILLRYPTYFF